MSNGRNESYLVAGSRPWNRPVFDRMLSKLPGDWHYAGSRAELTVERLREIGPVYLFFLHWSRKVPAEIVDSYECVAFHMTDLPYGRGGSPLQNLILRGHRTTRLSAFRMSRGFDAGPVYFKEDLSLEGPAEQIYVRATELSARMIERIVRERPRPVPQQGEPVFFRRRRPEQSAIPELSSPEAVYDFIRMLDCEGYPRAFVEHAGFRYEFRRAALVDGRVAAEVTITPVGEEDR